MNDLIRLACVGTFLTGLSLSSTMPAYAEAFAGVNSAFWAVRPEYPPSLPDGVTFSCFGGANGGGGSCEQNGSLTITNDSAVEITESLSLVGGFTITNDSGTDLELPIFLTDFSAFNPGGSEIGASVDDPAHEYATFGSSVFGPGVGDFHSCGVGDGPDFGTLVGLNSCGVDSPDLSEEELYLGTLDAGQTLTETYNIDIAATAMGVPEPGTLAVFAAVAMGGITILRRKRRTV